MVPYAAAACGLSEDGDVLGITAEIGDVALHPLEAGELIQHAEVGRCIRRFRRQFGMAEESEHVDAVCDRDKDDSAVSDALAVEFHLPGISFPESASEEPDHYGQFFVNGFRGRPDVQSQSVLIHGDFRIHMPLFRIECVGISSGNCLHCDRSEFIAFPYAFPALGGLRSAPAVVAARRRCKRDALENGDPCVGSGEALYHSAFSLCYSEHCFTLRITD